LKEWLAAHREGSPELGGAARIRRTGVDGVANGGEMVTENSMDSVRISGTFCFTRQKWPKFCTAAVSLGSRAPAAKSRGKGVTEMRINKWKREVEDLGFGVPRSRWNPGRTLMLLPNFGEQL
jgi:hypothetical protein